ncbi:hypothetical protein BN14_04248 [Rhizoctonia solani AG-1 IB]|uniref:Uncharacterized protein n=1 Tax=Thanatephorus cucumeris (strain AG1-IB / isolate 7/3/14) TaxID=1108050 RepID=M5BSP6_THACB|nr:hypothetical protein BN14_04248 [Rhizoctonia solani AG-1 IB]
MYLNGNDFQREKSWKRIYDGFINGKALLTLGTGETVTSEDRWKDVLIAAHNYAIVGLEDDGTTQNLKVLNHGGAQTRAKVCRRRVTHHLMGPTRSFMGKQIYLDITKCLIMYNLACGDPLRTSRESIAHQTITTVYAIPTRKYSRAPNPLRSGYY